MPSGRKPTSTESEGSVSKLPRKSDHLQYMADMLLELKAMAENEGCATLAGLLALAHSEAQLKARRS